MGLASKRRGGATAGASSSSSTGGPSRSHKAKKDKQQHPEDKKARRLGRRANNNNTPPVSSSSSLHPNPNNNTNHTNNHNNNNHTSNNHHHKKRTLEPTMLARGMSSRMVGARISHPLSILTPEETERDVRHMEAYSNACTAYAQQFFIFHNRTLVQNGHFGPVAGATTLTNGSGGGSGSGGNPASPFDSTTKPATAPGTGGSMSYSSVPEHPGSSLPPQQRPSYPGGRHPLSHPPGGAVVPVVRNQFAMPVRIDPEEEKRVAMLRKRIAVSEAQREILETEYMSLRAHFVNESQRLLRTRKSVDGQLLMLQDLIQKRGHVLALRRVRCAVARDILKCLERRTTLLEENVDSPSSEGRLPDASAAMQIEKDDGGGGDGANSNSGTKETNAVELADVMELWNDMEEQLATAEKASTSIRLPEGLTLLLAKKSNPTSRSRSKSPKETDTKTGSSSSSNNNNNSNNKKHKRRASEDGSGKKEGSDTTSDNSNNNNKSNILSSLGGEDDSIVLWESQIMPRTPYDVPVYYSHLSATPGKCAAFGTSGMFGSKKTSMVWLEPNLPESYSKMATDRENMLRLREEAQSLEDELDKERDLNRDLQLNISVGRKRSDEMCCMMTMLRSETEAVLNRHNTLLDTTEARSAAQAIHKQAMEDRGDQPSAGAGNEGNYEEEDDDYPDDDLNEQQQNSTGQPQQQQALHMVVEEEADIEEKANDSNNSEKDQGSVNDRKGKHELARVEQEDKSNTKGDGDCKVASGEIQQGSKIHRLHQVNENVVVSATIGEADHVIGINQEMVPPSEVILPATSGEKKEKDTSWVNKEGEGKREGIGDELGAPSSPHPDGSALSSTSNKRRRRL